ncbi:hypothetical protein CL629_02300 [bacterium]|nr:hypothetical protein [bacterium]|tara:strand:+ start:3817 stop:4158 length:342 start_codon:yes stop_codon:yes gene_type:complete
MEGAVSILQEVMPAIIGCAGLLWSFSKKVTQIEAQLQALQHQITDCKKLIEGNRQGRIEVFGVINNSLKPRDVEISERLARVETTLEAGITPSEVYTRLAKIEAELEASRNVD